MKNVYLWIMAATLAALTPALASAQVRQKAVVAPGLPRVPIAEKLLNGKVEVDPGCASEFPHWTGKLEFYDRPTKLCVRWIGKTATAWARWQLLKEAGANDPVIASGEVPAASLPHASSHFDIPLHQFLPLHNTGSQPQKYYVRVQSKMQARDTKLKAASQATLIHKPKTGEPVRPPGNPYACSSAPDGYARKVVLQIPTMTVFKTSNTPGDGDRDELYVLIAQKGPGTSSRAVRLPHHPDDDDYYEAKFGAEVGSNGWTNQDEEHVSHPVLYSGTLKHGQSTLMTFTAMEQDNADLLSVKNGLIEAMHGIAQVALSTNTSYGAIIAAVAEAVATGSQFIPNTSGHDVIGLVAVRLTNKCGNIQTDWVTYASKKIEGAGTLTNEFSDIDTLTPFPSRLAVLSTNSQFWPDGVDYGAYEYAGASDQFWWEAGGTSNSGYLFLLKARIVP